ncbi:MAG: hypothetical protein ACMXYG_02695 [Candidatus Woesearchaeota archaeon]
MSEIPELWFEKQGQEFARKFGRSLFALEDRISINYLQETLKELSIWPLYEAINISAKSLDQLISGEDKDRMINLVEQFNDFSGSPMYHMMITEPSSDYRFKAVTTNDRVYLTGALSVIETCYRSPEQNERAIIDRFLQDISAGGTFIYFLEKDGKPVIYNKLFHSISRHNRSVFFYDAIENGDKEVNHPIEWAQEGRLNELAYCIAFSVFAAGKLGITSVAMGDRELTEVTQDLGCMKRYTLPDDDKRKVGIPAHKKNKGNLIYQGRLWRDSNNKHRTIDLQKLQHGNQLIENFEQIYGALQQEGFRSDRKKFSERVDYLTLVKQALHYLDAGTSEQRAEIDRQMEVLNKYVRDDLIVR